jgi:hypothetical protein
MIKGRRTMENTKKIQPIDSAINIKKEVELSTKEFRDFITFLNTIKSDFIDCCIVDGAFRSYSKGNQFVVETGFRFFRGMNFTIVNIKNFIKVSASFKKSKHIKFTGTDDKVIISDEFGSFKELMPPADMSDNPFVECDILQSKLLNCLNPNEIIFSEGLPIISLKRIYRYSRILKSKNLVFKPFRSDLSKGTISISDNSEYPDEGSIELKNKLSTPIDKDYCIKLTNFPSVFKEDDLYITAYFMKDKSVLLMYTTKINNIFVNIYSQSELIHQCYAKYDI